MSRSRWAAVVGATVGALLLGAAQAMQASALAPGTARQAQQKTYSASLTLASYNIRHTLSAGTAANDVRRLTGTGVDVIGLQEMSSRTRRNAVLAAVRDCSSCVMQGVFFDAAAGVGAVPILFRADRFRLYDSGSVRLTDRTFVGAKGAGPSWMPPKYLNWVKLQDRRTGRFFYVMNSHTVASVQAKNGGANTNTRRLQLYRQHMAGVRSHVERVKRQQVGVFVLGDLNVNYRRDRVVRARAFPFANMAQVQVRASYEHLGVPRIGTHVRRDGGSSTRLIDYVYFLPQLSFTPVAQSILRSYSSDHRPVVVRFSVTGPGPTHVFEPALRW
jgi:endonuclease/exonuclease/phosphatase (EEP) superfamily protein YafD